MAAWARDIEDEQAGPTLAIDAIVFDPDGRSCVMAALIGPRDDPEDLGRLRRRVPARASALPLLGRNPVA